MFGHNNDVNSKLKYKTTNDFLQEASKQRYRQDSNEITSAGSAIHTAYSDQQSASQSVLMFLSVMDRN
jgi:hypothetical protein